MKKTIKNNLLLALIVVAFSLFFVSCQKNDEEDEQIVWNFSKQVAYDIDDDGWVKMFTYSYYKDSDNPDAANIIPFTFKAINLRYRYNDEYFSEYTYVDDEGEEHTKIVPNTIQIFGQGTNQSIKSDMLEISELLGYSTLTVTVDDLLSLTEDDISFEYLDENEFLNLINTALSAPAHEEGGYLDLPEYALLEETEYIDGYKFQIGFMVTMGCVDIINIDVLYKTGDNYNDYVQLYDLIKSGDASEEQVEVYDMILSLEKGIVENNDLLYDYKTYYKEEIGGVDFSRLYSFLKNLDKYNYTQYIVDSY